MEPTYIEVSLPDGTVARWAVLLTEAEQDALTDAIESLVGPAQTLRT